MGWRMLETEQNAWGLPIMYRERHLRPAGLQLVAGVVDKRGSSQAASCRHMGGGSADSQAVTRQTIARSAPGVGKGPGKSTAC